MNIKTAVVGALALAALTLGPALSASATEQPFTVVALEMPSWVDSTTPTWPQTVTTSVKLATPNLAALDAALPCGKQFQIDVHNSGPIVDALIAGGYLNGPNDPQEDLIEGGWGVAYKLIKTPPCPVIEQHADGACDGIATYVDHTWTTTDGVVSNELFTPRALVREDALALGCYTPPVVECAEGTVPGVLNEHGDATSCVSDDPCPETAEPGCPTTPDVPADLPPALPVTGVEVGPGLLGGAGALLLGLGMVILRKRGLI